MLRWGSRRREPHHQPLLLGRARPELGDELVHALPDLLRCERRRGVATLYARGGGCCDGERLDLGGDAVVLVDLHLVDDVAAALSVDLPDALPDREELQELALGVIVAGEEGSLTLVDSIDHAVVEALHVDDRGVVGVERVQPVSVQLANRALVRGDDGP